MNFRKIEAAIDFLKAVPTRIFSATDTDENYKDEVASLRKIMELMDELDVVYNEEEQSAFWTVQSHKGGDGLLLKLTQLAESQDKKTAIEACRELGDLYLGNGRPKGFKMPVSPEIAAGFFARAIRLGDKESKKDYADLAESLGWFNSAVLNLPKMEYEYDIRKTFNLHRVKMAEEFGGKLPKLDEFGLIPENKAEKTNDLREALNTYKAKMAEHYEALKAKIRAVEKGISDNVFKLGEMLDKKDKSLSKAKKRGKRLRWLVAWLIILAMVPGLIMGPGEGTQGLLYLLFLLPCTMNVLSYHDVSTFEEYMNAMPDADDRSTVFGATAAVILIACFVLNILISLFSNKAENAFEEYKSDLYVKNNIKDAVKEATTIANSARSLGNNDIIRLKNMGVKHNDMMLDELAIMYHAYLFCQNPLSVYQKLTNSSDKWKYSYKVPRWIYNAHKDIGNSACDTNSREGLWYALDYFDMPNPEDSFFVNSTNYTYDDETDEFVEDYDSTEYYTEYRKSLAIECLFAGFLSNKEKKIIGYPWRAKDMWEQFVSSNLVSAKTKNIIFRRYFENVADSAFLNASLNGDSRATFLLAEALFPSERGFALADQARNEGEDGAYDLYWKYDRYFHPPQEYVYDCSDDSFSSSSSSSSSEPDPDPWGFKAMAAEWEQKKIDRNNEILDNAYRYGDMDPDTYRKLKDKYGSW